ncbi:restriction endonuclease subunit S [Vibrio splendidus]
MPKQVVQPQIRFSEFEGKDWVEYPLSKVAKIERGRFSPRPRNDPQFYGGDIPFAQTNDVSSSGGYISTYSQTLNDKGLKVSKLFPEGTILMTIAANIGYCGLLTKAMACPDSLVGISCQKGTHNRFLNIYLNREQPKIDYLAPQAAQKNINIEFLLPYKVKLPRDEDEQQKIADFLSSIDTKTSQLTEKHRLFKEYKKGVMQQIFSQQIRFKDENGNAFPEWDAKHFCDVFTRVTTKNKEYNENVLTISAQKGLISQLEYFNKSVAAKDVSGYYLLHKGDFAYNKSYSQGYPMGAIKPLKRYEKGVVSTLYICFRPKAKFSEAYFEQFFDAGMLNREIAKIAQEGARNHGLLNVSVKEFFDDIKLTVPTLDEQKKIAQFLQSIDTKIEGVVEQIEQTKQFKKGLLQQMFV